MIGSTFVCSEGVVKESFYTNSSEGTKCKSNKTIQLNKNKLRTISEDLTSKIKDANALEEKNSETNMFSCTAANVMKCKGFVDDEM